MKLYIAPGNSVSNKEWVLNIENSLRDLFFGTYILDYEHWKEENGIMDLDIEAIKFKEKILGGDDFVVFAKSLGIILTLKAIKENKISPRFLIFLGFPINFCKENNIQIEEYLKGFSCPTLIIQNKNDPEISSMDLEKYLKKKRIKNYELIEFEGNTHSYDNLDEIKEKIKEFFLKV